MTVQVSVVMPVRNGERFLREALDSTLAQTLSDVELIVVDDGSTDGTPDILAEAARRDPRVRVQSQMAAGLTAAINAGCALANAPLIARMDADDVMVPDRLERQVAYLDAHPEAALLGGGIVLIDETGREIDREPGRPQLDFLVRNELTHATVMFRADAFEALRGYRLDQSEDYDLWLRFDESYGVAALAEPVIHYRLHPGQFSVTALERQALGFLCVREAALARRRGEADPLAGVERLDEIVLARLGISRERLDESIVSDAVQWAATLGRVGRDSEAAALLDAAAAVNGAPSRTGLARRARRLTLKRALRHGRLGEAAGELAAYARGK
jgi:glycosyltransferase involved in cell wall biosynthesis